MSARVCTMESGVVSSDDMGYQYRHIDSADWLLMF